MDERIKQTPIESLMTARQVADFLQVSVCTVGRWSRRGALKFYRVGDRGDMRYRLDDILRFLDESGTHSGVNVKAKQLGAKRGIDFR